MLGDNQNENSWTKYGQSVWAIQITLVLAPQMKMFIKAYKQLMSKVYKQTKQLTKLGELGWFSFISSEITLILVQKRIYARSYI